MEKVAKRSYNQIPGALADLSGLDALIQGRQKTASWQPTEAVPDLSALTRVAMGTPEAEYLLKTASRVDDELTEANGHIWRVAEIDGEPCILRDEERTLDTGAINDLLKGA